LFLYSNVTRFCLLQIYVFREYNNYINNIVMLSRQAVRYLSSRPVRRGRIAECGFVRFCAKLKAASRCPVNDDDFNNNYNNNVSNSCKSKTILWASFQYSTDETRAARDRD